jgi:tRNA(adenine34) deaminase
VTLDDRLMGIALRLARRAAQVGEVPVGAVVFHHPSGRLIAWAHNRRELDDDPTAHAEILALRRAASQLGHWRLVGCTLAVTLEPCFMCAGALVNARLDRLVYGATDPKAGAVHSLARLCEDPRLNHRLTVVSGVLAEPCSQALRAFFRQRRVRKGTDVHG